MLNRGNKQSFTHNRQIYYLKNKKVVIIFVSRYLLKMLKFANFKITKTINATQSKLITIQNYTAFTHVANKLLKVVNTYLYLNFLMNIYSLNLYN